MNIIFLDIDGVLNNDTSPRFDLDRIKIINHITNISKYKIVLSSTIRKNLLLLNKIKKLVHNIIDKTKDFSKYISHFETLRVAEIMEYISSHNINHFLVIDDAYLLIENFYLVGDNGLENKDIKLISNLLNF